MNMNLEQMFQKPDGQYMPVPWWALGGKLEHDLLVKQLDLMYEQDLREFFIYSPYGMEQEFMGEEYLNTVGFILDECEKRGMRVWIYDENNWPSGQAGGRLARFHPEAVGWAIRLDERGEMTIRQLESLMDDPLVLRAGIFAAGKISLYKRGSRSADDRIQAVLYRAIKDQSITICCSSSLWCKKEPGMLDVLSQSACRSFIDVAYQPFADRFPQHLGKTMVGFFTDEPHFVHGSETGKMPELIAKHETTINWNWDFGPKFFERYGYDFLDFLPDLTEDTATSEFTRFDYWKLITEIYANSYTGQIASWCEEHDLVLTGHLCAYAVPLAAVRTSGDSPAHLLKMQVPGCDMLGFPNSFAQKENRRTIIAAKLASSSARASGHNRSLCEAFGIGPWTRTMNDEKRLTDWLVALGINLINDNHLATDISDFRKRASSAKHFTQPWYQDASLYYDFAGRLCALSAMTQLDTELALLYPSATWWTLSRFAYKQDEYSVPEQDMFVAAMDALVRKHWDWEFLFEEVLANARIEDGRLVTGHASFSGIVIAGCLKISATAAAKLEQFAASGGRLIIIGPVPDAIDHHNMRKLSFPDAVSIDDWESDNFPDALDGVLEESVVRPWRVTGAGSSDIITSGRIDETGRRLLFLANMMPGKKQLKISWTSQRKLECWHAENAYVWSPPQTNGQLTLDLPEDESCVLIESDDPSQNSEPPAWFMSRGSDLCQLGGDWGFKISQPNLCGLRVRLKADKEGTLDARELRPDDTWIAVDKGDAGIELRPDDMKYYWLSAEFKLAAELQDLQVIVDSEDIEKAWLNGEDLGSAHKETVWDYENRAWEIKNAVQGINTLLLCVKPSPYYAKEVAGFIQMTNIVEPVVLRGSFAVEDTDGSIDKLLPLPSRLGIGDWREKGFRHFAGTGIYEKNFTCEGGPECLLITVNAGRDVVEVILDGQSLGKRAWGGRKFKFKELTKGEHHIEIRVTNTLGNVLRRAWLGETVNPASASGLLSPVLVEGFL